MLRSTDLLFFEGVGSTENSLLELPDWEVRFYPTPSSCLEKLLDEVL